MSHKFPDDAEADAAGTVLGEPLVLETRSLAINMLHTLTPLPPNHIFNPLVVNF